MKWLKENGQQPKPDDAKFIMSHNLNLAELVKLLAVNIPDQFLQELEHDLDEELRSIALYEDSLSTLEELKKLGMLKFDHLEANQKYITHLWQMTIEYAKGSLSLLESLYQENTQKELNAIKFITFGALITGFFGMNIAFPWEDRWIDVKWSSFIVLLIILSLFISFFYILKIAIYNRNFLVQQKKKDF